MVSLERRKEPFKISIRHHRKNPKILRRKQIFLCIIYKITLYQLLNYLSMRQDRPHICLLTILLFNLSRKYKMNVYFRFAAPVLATQWASYQIRAHAPGMTYSPPSTSKPLVNDPAMRVGIANPRWRGKRSRHSRLMRNPQFYVSS